MAYNPYIIGQGRRNPSEAVAQGDNPYMPEGGFDLNTPEGKQHAMGSYYADQADKQGIFLKNSPIQNPSNVRSPNRVPSGPTPPLSLEALERLERRAVGGGGRNPMPINLSPRVRAAYEAAGRPIPYELMSEHSQPGGGGAPTAGSGEMPSLGQVGPYTPGGGSQSPLVEERITGLLGSGNPYVEAARNRGLRNAHSRGLLNSSIATQAGEAAAIEAAFPIASQDAGSFQDLRMLERQGDIQSQLAREQHGYDIGTIGAQEGASSRLSEQDAQQALAFEQFKTDAERAMRDSLAGMQLSSDERKIFAEQVNSLGQQFLIEANNVQRDLAVWHTEKAAVIASLRSVYYAQLETLGNIYGVEIEWGETPDWYNR